MAAGLLRESQDHASVMVQFAQRMLQAAAAVRHPINGGPVQIRIGIHTGGVMSGIVGQIRARYCLFGACTSLPRPI